MANYNRGRYGKSRRRNKRRRSKFTKIENFAYQMGKVNRGLKNSNSRISESFQNGVNGYTTSANKKPLY